MFTFFTALSRPSIVRDVVAPRTRFAAPHAAAEAEAWEGPLDLQRALQRGGLTIDRGTAERLVVMHDRGRRGGLTVAEFASACDCVQGLARAFQRHADPQRSDLVRSVDARLALAAIGYHFHDPTLAAMVNRFDRESKGGLSFTEFVSLTTAIDRAAGVVAFDDPSRPGFATFSEESFRDAVLTSA